MDSFTKINTDNTRGAPYHNTTYNRFPSLPRAPSDSEWFRALQRNDCKTLLKLLEDKPELWPATTDDGRSVLHVAILQGCTELVHKLHKYQPLHSPEYSRYSSAFEILWEQAKDRSMCNASALDIWSIMDADLSKRSPDDYIAAHPMSHPLSDEEEAEIASLREVLSSYQEPFQIDMDDVNFNFDVRSELLIHKACSRLRNLVSENFESNSPVKDELSKIFTFISTVLNELKDKNLLQKLFKQKDARGRTILQVFVASKYAIANENKMRVESEFRKWLEILPPKCVNVRDNVGRTVLHWAVAHHSCWAVKILVESGKADLCATCKTVHCKNVTALHLAVIHDCDDCARHLLESNCNLNQQFHDCDGCACHLLESNRNLNQVSHDCDNSARHLLEKNRNLNKMNLSMEINISFSVYSQKKWRPLDLAIIMGRVKLARRMRQVKVCFTNLIPYC